MPGQTQPRSDTKASAIGVDVGSTTCKVVAIDSDGAVLAHRVEPSDPRIEAQSERIIADVREAVGGAGLPVGATGYGRKRVAASRVLTEITCHARGARHLAGGAGVLIDVGGQDTKVIHVNEKGGVSDFAMNDKCAAGTGRFLEVIFGRLKVDYAEVVRLARAAERAVSVSSTCTVFAESEVISLIAQGEPLDGIIRGLHRSLASRVVALAGRLAPDARLLMSGGVALNAAMVDALGDALGRPVSVLPQPQLVGALGAALAAG